MEMVRTVMVMATTLVPTIVTASTALAVTVSSLVMVGHHRHPPVKTIRRYETGYDES